MKFIIDPYRFGSGFPQPAAYYRFESDVTDSTLNSRDSDTETALTFGTGQVNNGCSFNGTTSYARFNTNTYFNLSWDGSSERAFTIAGWIYMDNTTSNDRLMEHGQVGTGFAWRLTQLTGNLSFLLASQGAYTNYFKVDYALASMSTGTWYHIAITYDASQTSAGLKMWVNGSDVGTDSEIGTYVSGGTVNVFTSFGCSMSGGTPTGFWSGDLDEFGFWYQELTSDQINYLYNSGTGRTWPL